MSESWTTVSPGPAPLPEDPQAYIEQVMAEIAEEVRLRRATGDLPPRLERELDELFLAHSPIGVRGGDLAEALRQVDAATFIDPVVPVESERAAGAFVKKGMRSLLHVVRRLGHPPDEPVRLGDEPGPAHRRRPAQGAGAGGRGAEGPGWWRGRVPDACPVAESWWVEPALAALGKAPGRVLHAACGDGWLVRRLGGAGVDAYGVDPRSALVDRAELGVLDLRGEGVADHLRAVAASALGGVVLSGVVEGLAGGERTQLLADVASRLAPGGTLIIHSVTRTSWESADAPLEADLAAGHPLRAETWCELLSRAATRPRRCPGPGAMTSW